VNTLKLKLSRYLVKIYLTMRYWLGGSPWYKARKTAERIVNGWD